MKDDYILGENIEKINHLLFMDNLKIYGKNIREIDSLIQTVRIFSTGIGMEFGISKRAMTQMKKGKIVSSEGMELSKREKIRSLEEGEEYTYLGVLESNKVKNQEIKTIMEKEYLRRIRRILKSRLNASNTIEAIKSKAVSLIRYGTGILEWIKVELQEMD